ncbi:DeoR family transcriptional regulator [Thermococcus thermotolerans]|uniref:DeoR family transcriptional regulator n=1 Tax=Thermococcus thermotolerans TaxID=2969672 RepID=UPI00215745E6|nr:DeoR family transcriptional regulator [Thermococcus thermotolerans]
MRRRIGDKEYPKLFGVSEATATRDLKELVKRGIFEKIGVTGNGTYYKLKPSKPS